MRDLRCGLRAPDFGPSLPNGFVRNGTAQSFLPEVRLAGRPFFAAGAVNAQTGRDNPCLAEAMVEHDQAVVEANMTFGQFEVVHGAARQLRLNEVFQIIAPVTETAAERER